MVRASAADLPKDMTPTEEKLAITLKDIQYWYRCQCKDRSQSDVLADLLAPFFEAITSGKVCIRKI